MLLPLAHSIPEACELSGSGRTALYEAIRSGKLRAVKRGRRTLILPDDLRRWVQSLPPVAVSLSKQPSQESKDGQYNPLGRGLRSNQELGATPSTTRHANKEVCHVEN